MFKRKTSQCVDTGLYYDPEHNVEVETAKNTANFSDKWSRFYNAKNRREYDEFQSNWFETLYGITRHKLIGNLHGSMILDAGCGGGGKNHNMSKLNPSCQFWGVDLSSELEIKALETKKSQNLNFLRADIANLPFEGNIFDLIICDQVLHHTKNPQATLIEFNRLLKNKSELLTYVYQKKALPRELLDQFFIDEKEFPADELYKMSDQLTCLGEFLQTNFAGEFEFPEVEFLNIPGGKMTLQRFIYDNFIKCFYNSDMGFEQSTIVNYDWYIPNIAYRYTVGEFQDMCSLAGFEINYLHTEPSCISGRLVKIKDV